MCLLQLHAYTMYNIIAEKVGGVPEVTPSINSRVGKGSVGRKQNKTEGTNGPTKWTFAQERKQIYTLI